MFSVAVREGVIFAGISALSLSCIRMEKSEKGARRFSRQELVPRVDARCDQVIAAFIILR
jgi:hypothetical protein